MTQNTSYAWPDDVWPCPRHPATQCDYAPVCAQLPPSEPDPCAQHRATESAPSQASAILELLSCPFYANAPRCAHARECGLSLILAQPAPPECAARYADQDDVGGPQLVQQALIAVAVTLGLILLARIAETVVWYVALR